ncbi:hypothetical protein ABW20_dc0100801 [Dactylellina cionopaga]|nr:hypothetical protein ABW20_dc0100801 [Dactylellina cionopaga]
MFRFIIFSLFFSSIIHAVPLSVDTIRSDNLNNFIFDLGYILYDTKEIVQNYGDILPPSLTIDYVQGIIDEADNQRYANNEDGSIAPTMELVMAANQVYGALSALQVPSNTGQPFVDPELQLREGETEAERLWRLVSTGRYSKDDILAAVENYGASTKNPFSYSDASFSAKDYEHLNNLINIAKIKTPEEELTNAFRSMLTLYENNPEAFPQLQAIVKDINLSAGFNPVDQNNYEGNSEEYYPEENSYHTPTFGTGTTSAFADPQTLSKQAAFDPFSVIQDSFSNLPKNVAGAMDLKYPTAAANQNLGGSVFAGLGQDTSAMYNSPRANTNKGTKMELSPADNPNAMIISPTKDEMGKMEEEKPNLATTETSTNIWDLSPFGMVSHILKSNSNPTLSNTGMNQVSSQNQGNFMPNPKVDKKLAFPPPDKQYKPPNLNGKREFPFRA